MFYVSAIFIHFKLHNFTSFKVCSASVCPSGLSMLVYFSSKADLKKMRIL